VVRLPCTGNETVLDAIAQIGGLSSVSSNRLWVARPAPAGVEDQILPVDWKGISRRGRTSTNYQLLPGDRLFVMSQPLTKFDTYFGRTLAPVERGFGFTLLGSTLINDLTGRFFQNQGGN
jgi:protein involved in polysaccharide export with SLBB domain